MSDIENIIDIEKKLNKWIIDALNYYKNNPNITKEDFDKLLKEDNIVLK